jgi:peptide-methionine (S)-S-oxide reductase
MKAHYLLMGAVALTVSVAGLSIAGLTSTASQAQERTLAAEPPPAGLAVATFAAGCFWCVEPPYDKLDGVVSTTSGYTDGHVEGVTYAEVVSGGTGHTEAVQVVYDPSVVSYETLLDTFWRNVDPLDADGQFCDRGDAYRPGIYTHDEDQAQLAISSKEALTGRFEQPIVVEIKEATAFWVAEEYHQNYYQKNPLRYSFYRSRCGRDARLQELWGSDS